MRIFKAARVVTPAACSSTPSATPTTTQAEQSTQTMAVMQLHRVLSVPINRAEPLTKLASDPIFRLQACPSSNYGSIRSL